MKLFSTLVCALLLLPPLVFAQQGSFHRGYFDSAGQHSYYNGGALAEASNGDFLYGFGYGLMRTDATGEPLWNASYELGGGTLPQRAQFSQFIPLPGGDAILLGRLPQRPASSTNGDTFLVCRATPAGSLVWSKMMPMPFPKSIQHRRSILTANGELLVGVSQSGQQPNFTIAMRMDLSGNVLWQHLYLNYPNPSISRQFYIWDVTECSNGDFIVGGFGSQPTDNIIARISSSGTLLWAKKLNPQAGGSGYGAPWRVRELSNGDIRVIINGAYNTWGMGYITLDASGNITGAGKAYKGSTHLPAHIFPNGDMLFTNSTATAWRVASAGSTVFAKKYSGAIPSGIGFSALCPTADDGFAAGGGYFPSGSSFASRGYLVKATSAGAAPPFDTAAFTLVDTTYNNTSAPISLLDSVVNIPLQSVTLAQETCTLNDTLFAATIDVKDVRTAAAIGMFPNPVKDVLHFATDDALNAEIFALDGRLVLSGSGVRNLNVSSLSPGLYFVRLMDEAGAVRGVDRIVKE